MNHEVIKVMKEWLEELRNHKKVFPIISFPAVQLLNCKVLDLLYDSHLQAQAMKIVMERCDLPAGIGLMDLSIEAECFGSKIRFEDNELPSVMEPLIDAQTDLSQIQVPDVHSKRAKVYIEAMYEAKKLIQDKPIFPGMIGPFSLAGRLLDVSEAMVMCYEDPDLLHEILKKATQFLIRYGQAFKNIGVNGIILAEPLAGILSPSLVEEFSCAYVQQIVDTLQDEEFIMIYHNCGNHTLKMTEPLLKMGCPIYHFGNAIDMKDMLDKIPQDILVMGNIDPVGVLRDGSCDDVKKAVEKLWQDCGQYPHFILSSGCDIPYSTPWDNIDCFIKTGNACYEK